MEIEASESWWSRASIESTFFFLFFFFNSIWLILSLTIKNAYPTYITYNAVLTLLTI